MAAIYLKYVFPQASANAVCNTQSALSGAALSINGNLSSTAGTVDFKSKGYARNLSFNSNNDLSNSIITVTGLQNNKFITENITGPNSSTVYSVNCFDVVGSITVSATITDLKVGTGFKGYFKMIPIDLTRNPSTYALSIGSLLSTNQYQTALLATQDISIINNQYSYDDNLAQIGNFIGIKGLGLNGNVYNLPASSATLTGALLVQILGSASTLTNGLTLIFIQT